jgi:UDP-3-O-[3-hydroxymyristoyl] glucosamine N-acyltransferase
MAYGMTICFEESMMNKFSLAALYSYLLELKMVEEIRTITDDYIIGFSPITQTKPGTLSWMKKQALDWSTIQAKVIICANEAELPENSNIIFIPVDRPRYVFAKVVAHFTKQKKLAKIEPTVKIGRNSIIGQDVYIGHYTVIGDNAVIGDDTVIHGGVHIYHDVKIGRRCTINSGTVIGTDGFGYEKEPDGTYFKFPHIGGVVLEDDVEIGANTCIDRGVLADTIIHDNVKIDNLCHIAHNVEIGKNSLVIAHAQLAGSVKVGRNSWIAPGVMVKNGLEIGENAMVGIGAVVVKDVPADDVVAARPAMSIKPRVK